MDILDYFKQITTIPRASGNEKQIKKIVKNYAKFYKLDVVEDKIGNLLVTKPATKNFISKPAITIQGHLDMVCEKVKGSTFNFKKDSLDIFEENGFLKARDTTLGADNGVAVAYMIALMENKTIEHPTLHFLFTVDEETGLTGAQYISDKMLKDKFLINLDSEEENIIYVGCAGGLVLKNSFKYKQEKYRYKHFYKIDFSNLVGGHSGSNIHENRENCVKVIFSYLSTLSNKCNFSLCYLKSGDKHNVIPRDGEIIINCDATEDLLTEANNSFCATINEPLKIESVTLGKSYKVVPSETLTAILSLMSLLPNGVKSMSNDFENVVETSSNLASVTIDNGKIEATVSIRSLVEKEKLILKNEIIKAFTSKHFNCKIVDEYPSWQPNPNSELLRKAKNCYNCEPKVTAIHAGLECGVLGAKKCMDMISIGPDVFDVHSPNERLSIESYYRTFDILCKIIGS